MNGLSVSNGLQGFPLSHVHFSGGRTGMAVAGHGGIVDLIYYGRQSLGGASVFRSDFPHSPWPKIFRVTLEIDGQAYAPDFQNARLYPFGFEAKGCSVGVEYFVQVFLLNDALVQSVRILDNPANSQVRLKASHHGHVRTTPDFRKWTPWVSAREGNGVVTSCRDVLSETALRAAVAERKTNPVQKITFENTDVADAEIHVGVCSTNGLSHKSTGGVHEGFKHYFLTQPFSDEAALIMCFHPEQGGLTWRMKDLSARALDECRTQVNTWQSRIEQRPRIGVGSPEFRSCLENIPGVLDSLKVADIPGAMRAAAHGYWVWSWDNLVYPEAHLFANDAVFIRDLLRFVIAHRDPVLGIPHQFNTRLTPQMAMAFPVQCLFITTLYSYYCHTGDEALLAEAFPFAVWIVERCEESKVGNIGLIEGTSLYPDYPGLLGQDGRDLSVFNNSVYYQGIVALSHLAAEMGRITGADTFAALSRRCSKQAEITRAAFLRFFFDSATGYYLDSVSATDFSRRKHHPVYAILWVSPFARELLGSHVEEIADFLSDHFVRPHGLGMFPEWDTAWMCDGNQCGAYYPVVEPFFRNVMKLAGRPDELKVWTENVAWFWQSHTIPEGLTYESENELPDNPGAKQAFAAKAWYSVFLNTILGLEPGPEGITLRTGPFVVEGTVKNISIRNKSLDVHMVGTSGHPKVMWNGREMSEPVPFIPYSEMKDCNEIILKYA